MIFKENVLTNNKFVVMAWVAISKNGNEYMFHNKPVVNWEGSCWHDKVFYDEYRACSTCANDGSILMPKGTIKKIIKKVITWEDGPIEIK